MSASSNPRAMMGLVSPGDQKVSLPIRDWSVIKLALWRSKGAFEIAARAAVDIISRCRHVDGCPGKTFEDEPCVADQYAPHTDGTAAELVSSGCPDREQRMSALVVLNAARAFAPVNAVRPANEPYMAPSREYYSEILAELVTAHAEIDALREELLSRSIDRPTPTAQLTP